jgi:hypothetical protein
VSFWEKKLELGLANFWCKKSFFPGKIPYFCNVNKGVSHCGLAIYIKTYPKEKEELWNSNISPCKNIIFKKSSKRNQNPSKYYNSITNLSFNTSQNIIIEKSSYKNRPIT